MRVVILSLAIVSCIGIAKAALAPHYQNERDLDVITNFIKIHPTIMSGLKSIDFQKYTVYFGKDCIAVFGRESTQKPPGWVGPADPLEFKNSNCPVD